MAVDKKMQQLLNKLREQGIDVSEYIDNTYDCPNCGKIDSLKKIRKCPNCKSSLSQIKNEVKVIKPKVKQKKKSIEIEKSEPELKIRQKKTKFVKKRKEDQVACRTESVDPKRIRKTGNLFDKMSVANMYKNETKEFTKKVRFNLTDRREAFEYVTATCKKCGKEVDNVHPMFAESFYCSRCISEAK